MVLFIVGCQVTTTEDLPTESDPESNSEAPEPTVQSVEIEPENTPTKAPTATPEPTMPDLNDNPLVSFAMNDLANRLNVSPAEITVVEATQMTWPDSSMGCQMPNMVYMQVLSDGMFIQLSVNDLTYNYHSGGNRKPFLCEQQLKTDKKLPGQIDLPTPPPSFDE